MRIEMQSCESCIYLQKILEDKEKEIKKLKLNIKKLNKLLGIETNEGVCSDSLSLGCTQDENGDTYEEYSFESDDVKVFDNSPCVHISESTLKKSNLCFTSKTVETQTTLYANNEKGCFKDVFDRKELFDKLETETSVDVQNDYVYDGNSQLYYSHSSGYYFDQNHGVFFEPKTRACYRYNYSNQEYESVSSNDYNCFNKLLEASCESVVEQVNSLNINDVSTCENSSRNTELSNHGTMNLNDCFDEEDSLNSKDQEIFDFNEYETSNSMKDWQLPAGTNVTVGDLVKEVVEQHCGMSDYIYDESCCMYYSPSTGYYYDSVKQLLYDPSTGIYYRYDSENQSYEFFSQVELKDFNADPEISCKQKSRKAYWKKKMKKQTTSEEKYEVNEETLESSDEFSSPEDGEIFSSDSELDTPNQNSEAEISPYDNELYDRYDPCIRAIVECSEKLKVGSLLLITCEGGVIGRDKENPVHIPDFGISKSHAEVKYDKESRKFSIRDLGSQNGTFVNDKRLSEPKEKSLCCLLSHGDRLSLSSCQLLLHIHIGLETCEKCEPGQVLAELASKEEKPIIFKSKEEKEKERKRELGNIKKKYGLKGMAFDSVKSAVVKEGYEDKAELRRHTVGSENPYEKNVESSMDVAMSTSNKGYQMLQKMGWREGETLGAQQNSGILEPIALRPWTTKAGFGCPAEMASAEILPVDKRKRKWVKAQERYFQLT